MKNTKAKRQSHAIGAGVDIKNLTKHYGRFKVIDDVSVTIEAGEFVTFLGPSGSGKTTTIMAIAGFAGDYSGQILIGGKSVDGLPAHKRNIGMVFQHFALFPHMTVADNVAFPLRMRQVPKAEIARRVGEALAMVQLATMKNRLPAQLSGGQQQRVALARAVVFDPPVLLLDEPMGALDRKLREDLQFELKNIHQRLGITIIHVTHDQAEAMAVSDKIAVIDGGKILQYDTPVELYRKPNSRFVAEFVGESVMLEGTIEKSSPTSSVLTTAGGLKILTNCLPRGSGGQAALMLRPEGLSIGARDNSDNVFHGHVEDVSFTGDRVKYRVRLNDHDHVAVDIPNTNIAGVFQRGDVVDIAWGCSTNAVLFEK